MSSPQPARIVARKDGVWLESTVQQQAGHCPLTLNFHGREMDSRLHVTVETRGQLTFSRQDPQPNHNPTDQLARAT